MEFKKIDDKKFQCLLFEEDLEENNISLDDFFRNDTEKIHFNCFYIRKVFQNIYKTFVIISCHYHPHSFSLWCIFFTSLIIFVGKSSYMFTPRYFYPICWQKQLKCVVKNCRMYYYINIMLCDSKNVNINSLIDYWRGYIWNLKRLMIKSFSAFFLKKI